MAGRVYSERFMQVTGAGVAAAYIVPAQKRVVVRCIMASVWQAQGAQVWFGVAGVSVLYWQAPGAVSDKVWDVRLVAYAGERLELVTYGTDVRAHVSGYLLDAPGDSGAAAKPVDPEGRPRPTPSAT